MSSKKDKFIVWARCCVVTLADEYVCAATYGDPKKDAILSKILSLRCLIKALENQVIQKKKDFIKDGVLFFHGRQVLLSKNNSLSLVHNGKRIPVTPANCLTGEDVCRVVSKIRALCSEC